MLILVLLLLALVLLAAIWIAFLPVPELRQVWMMRKLPGPNMIPVFGLAHEFPFIKMREIMWWFQTIAVDGYDRVSAFWVAGLPIVVLNDVDDIEVVLSNVKYIDKGYEYSTLTPWLQEGLLISTGNKWHTRRKLLTPTFHFKILDDKSKTMYINARKFVKRLLAQNGQPFDASEMISSCTLDVIGETAMGVSLNSQDDQSSEYVETIKRVTDDLIYRVLNPYFLKSWLWAISSKGAKNLKDVAALHNFTSEGREHQLLKRNYFFNLWWMRLFLRNSPPETELCTNEVKKRQAFLDKLLELDATHQGRFTDSDIREEVDTFLFEGHDTTATLILYALFELGHNPDVQELAYREQYEIFGDEEREATLDDLQNMNYLDRFIKECLRLYPPVPYLSRYIREDLHLKDLPPVPRYANVTILPYFLHRNPKYFPDPEKFDPDRFLPDECTKRHPFSYIPFSAGPRNCIGQKFAMMELKTLLSTVIRFTRVKSVTEKSEIKLVPVVILRTLDTILIRVERRN